MAELNGESRTDQAATEVYTVALDAGDTDALRADPEAFTRNLLGPDIVVNGVHLSKAFAEGSGDTAQGGHLIHVLHGLANSNWIWVPDVIE